MAFVRPVHEAENRLARFNGEKAAILAEVERRVVEDNLHRARRGGEASLEYVLNDVAFQEIRRLERSARSSADKKRLGEWRGISPRVRGERSRERTGPPP